VSSWSGEGGLLALSVGVGLGVVHELMELEVAEVAGPKNKHNPDRTAKRHGHQDGSLTLDGRRVGVRRPRIRPTTSTSCPSGRTSTSPIAIRSPGR
jgi:putative transposase